MEAYVHGVSTSDGARRNSPESLTEIPQVSPKVTVMD
jgi:hypothetical protein